MCLSVSIYAWLLDFSIWRASEIEYTTNFPLKLLLLSSTVLLMIQYIFNPLDVYYILITNSRSFLHIPPAE